MPAPRARRPARGVVLSASRCSAASLDRGEDLAGSAAAAPAIVLLEYPGPWGISALRDARLPEGLGPRLASAVREAGVKLLLIRRPGRPLEVPDGHRVFAIHAGRWAAWAETAVLDRPEDLLDLDLTALRAGTSVGLEPHERPVFAVCTHGRHDACCAERGRPVAAALAAAHPEETWEISHLGGDRFAANMLLAPDGLYYGRLDPQAALAVAAARLRDEVELDHLRGRAGRPMPVQAAEIALRRHLGVRASAGPRLASHTAEGLVTTARFGYAGGEYAVRVRSTPADPALLTCRAAQPQHALRHEILEITGS